MAVRKVKKRVTKRKVAKRVRCIGKTKAGKRCKRMTTAPSKKCHHHRKKR